MCVTCPSRPVRQEIEKFFGANDELEDKQLKSLLEESQGRRPAD